MHWKLPFLVCELRCHGRRQGETDWTGERREKRRGGLQGRCWTTMTHRDGRAEVPPLPRSLVVSVRRISLFTVPSRRSSSTQSTRAKQMQVRRRRLRTQAGVVDRRDGGVCLLCAECLNLWLIIIWPHKGRCWGNSSACVECNLLCFSFPCGLKSGQSGELTGYWDACTSDTVGLRCWNCCIRRKAPMERTALFRVTPS